MAGLMDFPSGILDAPAIHRQVSTVPSGVPDWWHNRDVSLAAPRFYAGHPPPTTAFQPNINFVNRPESANVIDQRYMTSPNNPFMNAAQRFSVDRGYYIPHTTPLSERPNINLSPAEIEKLNKAFEEYIRRNKEQENEQATSGQATHR